MAAKRQSEKDYDFTCKDPNVALTSDELKHFDEGMRLKNESSPANKIDFKKAAQSVTPDMDRLLS